MPTVPFDRRTQAQPGPQPTPQQLLMALATMRDLGRLNPNQPMQVADKTGSAPIGLVTKAMNDDEYDASWVGSIARKGRSDEEMRALHPDLEAYKLGPDSDLITYHKRKKEESKLEDLVS